MVRVGYVGLTEAGSSPWNGRQVSERESFCERRSLFQITFLRLHSGTVSI